MFPLHQFSLLFWIFSVKKDLLPQASVPLKPQYQLLIFNLFLGQNLPSPKERGTQRYWERLHSVLYVFYHSADQRNHRIAQPCRLEIAHSSKKSRWVPMCLKLLILRNLLSPALPPLHFSGSYWAPFGRLCKSQGHRGSLFRLFLLSFPFLDPFLPPEVENSYASLMQKKGVLGSPQKGTMLMQ